jgi:hypothetical protein
MRTAVTTITALFILLIGGVTVAEQRALLVGVGNYQHPGINYLPAIDLDLERMRETLIIMGFEDHHIKSLLDQQATAANVIGEFKTWLTEGVGPNDRVVFYYSGHGSNIPDFDGDEDDGADEVLVTHDARPARRNGKPTLDGVVDDDTIGNMLGKIKSNNIWVIVDACHSGTVTRDIVMINRSLGSDPIYTKSFTYPGMPEGETAFSRSFAKDAGDNFVSLSAAGDREAAIGTSQGGVFTIGLTEAIRRHAQSGKPVNIYDLRDAAGEYIREHVDESRVHNPQVTGSERLANGALTIIPLTDGNGPNRRRVVEYVTTQNRPFQLGASNSTYTLDEPVELIMTIPVDGYLNVVTVDSMDNATVLFPNRYHSDHRVEAGEFAIPTDRMTFELPASEPVGPTLVAAFVTTKPVNFYESSVDERTAAGLLDVDFSTMSHTATRAIRVAAREDAVYAAMLELDVVGR